MNQVIKDRTERTKWYNSARFGMFIHWGLYAIPARGEWVRSVYEIPKEEYEAYFDEFTTENYNPKEWARLAKKAGMKYAVLTAKHHDGFCLFDTKLTDFNSVKAPCKRDLVKEFLEAFREEGIKVGLYYSIIDWRHEDFPHFGDMYHPMRNNEKCSNENRNFDRYLEFMFGQIKELLTNYGHLDLMWFDFSYGDMKCDKWKARELMEMVRSIQPHIIIDNVFKQLMLVRYGTYKAQPHRPLYGHFLNAYTRLGQRFFQFLGIEYGLSGSLSTFLLQQMRNILFQQTARNKFCSQTVICIVPYDDMR